MADKYSCTTDLVFTPLGSRLLLVTQGLLVLYAILLVSSIPLQINGGRADGEGRCEQKVDFVRDKTYYISRSLFFCHFSFQGTQRKHFKMVCVFNFFFRFHCICELIRLIATLCLHLIKCDRSCGLFSFYHFS